mmetsp:Transcript_29272/g.39571  ORF Transcript_29272/g.39571 Transcript_29272/m.39571 type:complete len:230 (-) Transcript_29272:39-728(-)
MSIEREPYSSFFSKIARVCGIGSTTSAIDFAVKEVIVTQVSIWEITVHLHRGDSGIGVSEVNIPHIVRIVEEIWVQSIIVPEVVKIILTSPVSCDHVVHEFGHSVADIGPEDRSQHVEVTIDRSKNLVVRVMREAAIGIEVRESLIKSDNTMLHKSERAKPEDTNTRASESSPVTIQVHLKSLVEDTVPTSDGFSFNTLSKIIGLLRNAHKFVDGGTSITFVETKEALG